MNLEKIEKLNELKEKGMITEAEFQRAKEKILEGQEAAPDYQSDNTSKPATTTVNNNEYTMFMHLSLFASFIVPFSGIIAVLVMWQTRKENHDIDQHGKAIMNWVFSLLIYSAIGWMLQIIVVGYLLLFLLLAFFIIFTIISAINANKGIISNYPMTIKFFSVEEKPPV